MTEIRPVVAPLGTVAVIEVSLLTVYVIAVVMLKITRVTPMKVLPVIVTTCPAAPLSGENELMDGRSYTVKFRALLVEPAGVVTVIGPVVAPLGTNTVIDVSLEEVILPGIFIKRHSSTPVKPVPEIVTLSPTNPNSGVNELILGLW